MTQPSDPHFSNITNSWSVSDCMLYFISHFWIYPIKDAGKNSFPRFPNNAEDWHSNKETNKGVCQRITQPHAPCTDKHHQAGQAIYTRVVAISDQGGATNLFAHLDAIESHRLIAKESND